MKYLLGELLKEVNIKTTKNNEYPTLTSSKSGIFKQDDYFTKNVASKDNTGYKVIRFGQFTYRSMSDTGLFFINCLTVCDVGIVSPAYPVFEIKDEKIVDRDYLSFFFKSTLFNKKISLLSKGTTRLSLKYKDLCKVEIDLPELLEQKNIASKLKDILSLQPSIEKKLYLVDEMINAKFFELFGDVEKNTKGFPVKKLNDIADYWNGLTYKPSDVVEEGTLVLRSSNIQDGELAFEDNVYVNCQIKEKLFVKNNDILMCSRNGSSKLVGKVAIITGLEKPTTFGAFMMIFRSRYYSYLKIYFENSAFRNQVSTDTTTINQITGAMLGKISLPIPDINLVDSFSEFLISAYDLKHVALKEKADVDELLEIKMEEYFE